ncbi:MAG: hypothetical protein A4E53_03231 [Pelotomaculum sp. PtaB.Bin104]|nr:MAG: hypothetical protein A4E53_03231 [Pelotomaculum sp. PtaB.Bin104]
MENLVWAILLWALVFILIPIERIKILWPVAVAAPILLFIIDYIFVKLGYFQFTKFLVLIAGVPPFHLLGGSAGALLLMNWMQKNPLIKVLLVASFSGLLVLSAHLFETLDAFTYLSGFNHILDYVLNVAGLSVLVWVSLALVDEDRLYFGENKTNFIR